MSIKLKESVIGTDEEIVGVVFVRSKLLNNPKLASLSILVDWRLIQELT